MFCCLFQVFLFGCLHAQLPPVEWGKIPYVDLEMNTFRNDTSAEAVVLCDYGTASFESVKGVYRRVYTRFTRIKILSPEGTRWANIRIPYEQKLDEEVLEIKAHAFTLRPDGETEIKEMDRTDVIDDMKGKRIVFTIPGVYCGSVLEYEYKIISPDFFNIKPWKFQWPIPVMWSELRVSLVGIYDYIAVFHNINQPLRVNEKTNGIEDVDGKIEGVKGDRVIARIPVVTGRYVMTDMPAFREEILMGSAADYLPEMRFQLYSIHYPGKEETPFIQTWDDMAEQLMQEPGFGSFFNSRFNATRYLRNLSALPVSGSEKLVRIFHYVRDHCRWNDEYSVISDIEPDHISESVKMNSAGVNLFLIALLKASGLQAWPVLISTRPHGRVQKDIPLLAQFNDVLCMVQVDNKTVFLDATDPDRPWNLIKPDLLNQIGLIIYEKKADWVDLPSPSVSSRNIILSLRFQTEGTMHGFFIIQEDGEYAVDRRRALSGVDYSQYSRQLIANLFWGLNMDSSSYTEHTNRNNSIELTIAFSSKEWLNKFQDKNYIYFDGMIRGIASKNIFSEETRRYPIMLSYPTEEKVTVVIEIPEGYAIEALPEEDFIALPGKKAEFLYGVSGTEEVAQMQSLVKINKTFFTPAEFDDLKHFFAIVSSDQDQQVVAVKEE